MRILIVNAIGFVGGAERWIVHLVERLAPRGHAIEVAHDPRSPLGWLARAAGAGTWIPRSEFRGLVRSVPSFAREIRDGSYDVVVSTTRTDLKLAGFAARLAGHPGVVARLNSGWSPFDPVVTSGWRWRRHRWYHRHLVQLAATNSRTGKSDLVERDFLPPERIEPIYNGVDLARFDPESVPRGEFRAELGIPPGRRLVASISRFVPRKGQEVELEALGRIVSRRLDTHAVFLGPCRERERPYREALMARAGEFPGAGRIHFLEERDDVPRILADADLLVRAALTEGLPNCALEAQAMRVPVVATGICGTPEAVLDGETGWLVPPADDRALEEALEAALFRTPEDVLRRMGESGRAHVLEHFTLGRMADRYEALFERALAERGR